MLSGIEILKQIENGNIIISDFTKERLNPNSYNIRLGKNLKIYKKANVSNDEITAEITKRIEPYREEYGQIVNQIKDVKSKEEIDNITDETNILIEKLTKKQEEITNEVIRYYALDPKKDNETTDIIIPKEGYVMVPGVLYLGETMEYTETYGFVPKIDGRSTTGRLGIEVHKTAGFGDNGFKGKWTLEITVIHPVIVYEGMEIGQLYYETIEGETSMLYNGKYQNQQGVQAAKIDKD